MNCEILNNKALLEYCEHVYRVCSCLFAFHKNPALILLTEPAVTLVLWMVLTKRVRCNGYGDPPPPPPPPPARAAPPSWSWRDRNEQTRVLFRRLSDRSTDLLTLQLRTWMLKVNNVNFDITSFNSGKILVCFQRDLANKITSRPDEARTVTFYLTSVT